MSTLNPIIPLVALLVALFFVLLPCIWFAIEKTELRRVNGILAPAATVLCILSMMGNIGNTAKGSLVGFVLIPWAALGVSILFVLLLCLLGFLHGKLLRFFEDKYSETDGEDECNDCEVRGKQPIRDDRNRRHGRHEDTRDARSSNMLARSERRIQKNRTKEL